MGYPHEANAGKRRGKRMRVALAMRAGQIKDAARGLTEFAGDETTLAIVRAIEETIVAQAKAAPSGPSVVIIDLEPGQWRVWKDALMLAGAFPRLALTISAALEQDNFKKSA